MYSIATRRASPRGRKTEVYRSHWHLASTILYCFNVRNEVLKAEARFEFETV